MKTGKFYVRHTLIGLALLMPLTIQAATLDDVVNSIKNLYNLMSLTIASVSDLLYEPNPSLPQTMATNLPQDQAKADVKKLSDSIILPQIKQDLLQEELTGDNPPKISFDYLGKSFHYKLPSTLSLANKPASDYYAPILNPVARLFAAKTGINYDAGNANMNFDSLLAPQTYTNGNLDTALNYVSYASRLDQPLMDPAMGWTKLDDQQKKDLIESEAGQQYRVALRSLIANRSVALDNLFQIISDRVPQKSLANSIPGGTKVSPYALEQYMATRRTNSVKWYSEMQSAAPATVAREQLLVLTEIEKLLFQLHQDNQRVLATLSMMQLHNTMQAKMHLRTLERNAAKVIDVKLSGEPDAEAALKASGIEIPTIETPSQ